MKSYLSTITAFAFGVLVGGLYMQHNGGQVPEQPEVSRVENLEQPTNAPQVAVEQERAENNNLEYLFPVSVGDTAADVSQALGEPYLEFPKDGCHIQWYAGYEIILTNGVVSDISERPVETEEERLERARYAEIAAQQIQNGYKAMSDMAAKEYNEWLRRKKK